ncbi:class I SAM-dependent methyltransferase [Azorhizobium doebereinerae]|uniref:class I SAM-dependent methyltransferase n=1 Tax=Azorhizobium doebereinerae TaxID=281091 RepID=UPI00040E954E|nr:class I SAM-dependent methyltransferase [Azorhizobium doebereinerae]
MIACRVCGAPLGAPAYEAAGPSMTSIMTLIEGPMQVFVCEGCGHAQSPDLPDIRAFYDTGYRISLASEDHDQIFAVGADGQPIYRTAHQAGIALRLLDPPQGARVLDYGAAKATTLRTMMRSRPDLKPAVFDVSTDYAAAWEGWVAVEDRATYEAPLCWTGRFDTVMSHFVLEHVAEPVPFLKEIWRLLKPEGRVLISVPDAVANPGDMMVADHLNHFSAASLARALEVAGFRMEACDATAFPGAFFVTARKSAGVVPTAGDAAEAARAARAACGFWGGAAERLAAAARRLSGQTCAIYGAGFYGAWIASRVAQHVTLSGFLDQNPNLAGSTLFERPVMPPADLPADVTAVFIGLNPKKARAIIAQVPALQRDGLERVWLDD